MDTASAFADTGFAGNLLNLSNLPWTPPFSPHHPSGFELLVRMGAHLLRVPLDVSALWRLLQHHVGREDGAEPQGAPDACKTTPLRDQAAGSHSSIPTQHTTN